jgi:hypothetical protein
MATRMKSSPEESHSADNGAEAPPSLRKRNKHGSASFKLRVT